MDRFYGESRAVIRDSRGLTPRDYFDLLSSLWCPETCAPRMRADWTPDNPTLGQCSVTAFLAQDIFGGRVLGVPLPDGNFHCFNEAGGRVFDLTSEQFGGEKLRYEGCPEQRRETHFARAEKRARYLALRESLRLALEGITLEEIWLEGSLGRVYGQLLLTPGNEPGPLVILSHGFGGDHMGLADYAAHFARSGLNCLSLDFGGGGPASLSDGAMTEMTVLTESGDLNAAIDRFRADPRFSRILLWGGSQGGFVTACTAARRPADISRAVLEFPAIVLQDDARARALPEGGFPDTSRVMGLTIGRCYNEAAVSFDLYDLLPACRLPVLILHGDRDPVVPLRYSRRAARVLPDAHLEVLEGQGHGFTGEGRQRAMALETAFLTEKE